MPFPSKSKVFIFDWDDTLCPSSYAEQWKIQSYKDLPIDQQKLFHEVGIMAERCLELASRHGEVLIITNSDDGWVKFSAQRFLPHLVPVVEKFRVISARTRYEQFYPSQPLCWKAAAFAHESNEIFEADQSASFESMASTDVSSSSSLSGSSDEENDSESLIFSQREIISFGDSMEERTAVRIVANQLSAVPKSVMFVSSPTPLQILGQLNLIMSNMEFVCDQRISLDLEISPSQARRSSEKYIERLNNGNQQQQNGIK